MSTTYIEDWHGFFPATETTEDALVVYQTSLEEEGVLNPDDESGHCELSTRTVNVDGVPYIEAQFSAYREVASGSENILALERRDLAELAKGTMVVRGYDEGTAEVYAFGYVNGEAKQGENYCSQAELFREMHRLQFNAIQLTPWKVAEPATAEENK